MSPSNYTSAKSGTLRLKGVTPTSKIQKPKKKRPKPSSDPTTTSVSKPKKPGDPSDHADPDPDGDANVDSAKIEDEGREGGEGAEGVTQQEQQQQSRGGKTEAEIRHEERRRRRLEERLKREGTKTHKEKVEEFNHYLSNLSEHHDMPRIGPG
ncbi:MAG: hypothetical protein LQ339_001473 [Xanthoria mediterranea]|nr:MAG: hypothetical protein LQ339_001473 [Xanthoria mediterranea]